MKHKTKHFVLTGAESSGKTTLANALVNNQRTEIVQEVARQYIHDKDNYDLQDVFNIGRMQHKLESEALTKQPEVLISDTDLLTISIWLKLKFSFVDDWVEVTLAKSADRHYLLCDWDIPYKEDPLREDPNSRDLIFAEYQSQLKIRNLSFTLISGTVEERLEKIAEVIEGIS